jgi:hypothetical protein
MYNKAALLAGRLYFVLEEFARMPRFVKILSLILIIALTACSGAVPTAGEKQGSTVAAPPAGGQVGDDYPVETTAANNPPSETYPGPPLATNDPLSQYPETLQVTQPDPGKGVVTGRVLELANGEVFLAPSLFLGRLTFASDPNAAPPLVGFSETTSPQGVQDRTGKFMFTNIEPGTYAVVVWTPGSSTLLTDKEGNTAIIELAENQVADMGDIYAP